MKTREERLADCRLGLRRGPPPPVREHRLTKLTEFGSASVYRAIDWLHNVGLAHLNERLLPSLVDVLDEAATWRECRVCGWLMSRSPSKPYCNRCERRRRRESEAVRRREALHAVDGGAL